MKKFLFILAFLLLYSNFLYGAEFKFNNFNLNVYSNIYGDFFTAILGHQTMKMI